MYLEFLIFLIYIVTRYVFLFFDWIKKKKIAPIFHIIEHQTSPYERAFHTFYVCLLSSDVDITKDRIFVSYLKTNILQKVLWMTFNNVIIMNSSFPRNSCTENKY